MSLHYVRRGSGPPLVLVPGTSSDWRIWEPVLDRLAAERDVIAVDVPGFGASAPLPDGVVPDPPALARAVAGLLDELGLRRAHVAGNSLGAAIALEIGRLRRATSICALAPIGFWTRREAAYCAAAMRTAHRAKEVVPGAVLAALMRFAAGRSLLLWQVVARPAQLAPKAALAIFTVPSPDLERIVAAYQGYAFRAGDEIDCPLTVAWGTRDRLLLPREGRRVPRVIPRTRMTWLDGLGHLPMWDDPERTARVMLDASA